MGKEIQGSQLVAKLRQPNICTRYLQSQPIGHHLDTWPLGCRGDWEVSSLSEWPGAQLIANEVGVGFLELNERREKGLLETLGSFHHIYLMSLFQKIIVFKLNRITVKDC